MSEQPDCLVHAKCGHAIMTVDKRKGEVVHFSTMFDYCEDCKLKIERQFNKLQTDFEGTFHGVTTNT